MHQDNYPAGVTDATIEELYEEPEVPIGATCSGCAYCQRVQTPDGSEAFRVCAWCPMAARDWESGLELVAADRPACQEWEAA